MYYAIVFLPLLGAIIGGAVTLFGGFRTRRAELIAMGGGSGHDHHHGHDDHHAHAKHDHGHGHGHDDHDHDDHHGPDYPIAPGARFVELVTTGFLIVAALLSWVAFIQHGLGH